MKQLIRRCVAGIALSVGLLAIAPTITHADDVADATVTAADGASLVVTAPVLSIVTGLLLPFVIALITKAATSSTVKAVVGIVVAAIAATIQRATQADGHAVFTAALLLDIGLVYGPQLLTYLGLWSKLGQGGINAKLLPNTGIV